MASEIRFARPQEKSHAAKADSPPLHPEEVWLRPETNQASDLGRPLDRWACLSQVAPPRWACLSQRVLHRWACLSQEVPMFRFLAPELRAGCARPLPGLHRRNLSFQKSSFNLNLKANRADKLKARASARRSLQLLRKPVPPVADTSCGIDI